MNEEKHIILNVSEPQTEEEKIKVFNSEIATALTLGAIASSAIAISGYIGLGANLEMENIFTAIIYGMQALTGSICTLITAKTTSDYLKLQKESENMRL